MNPQCFFRFPGDIEMIVMYYYQDLFILGINMDLYLYSGIVSSQCPVDSWQTLIVVQKWSKSVTFYTTCLLNLYGSAAAKIYYLDSLNGNATKSSGRDRVFDVLSCE